MVTNNPPPPASTNFLDKLENFQTRYFKLSVTPQLPFDADKGLELKYDLSVPMFGTNTPPESGPVGDNGYWEGSFYFSSQGTYKLKSSDTNVADFININLTGQALYTYLKNDPLDKGNQIGYFIGGRLKAVEFESDQQFKTVNLTVKPQIAFEVPYTDLLGGWWTLKRHIYGNSALPVTIYGGYTYVDPIRTNSAMGSSAVAAQNRWQAEVEYNLPITAKIDVGFRGQEFYLEHGQTRGYMEGYGRYKVSFMKDAYFVLSYTTGSLPPKFQNGHSFNVGYDLKF